MRELVNVLIVRIMHGVNNVKNTNKCNFVYVHEPSTVPCVNFHDTHKCSTPLRADLSYRFSPKSSNKYGKSGEKFTYVPLRYFHNTHSHSVNLSDVSCMEFYAK
jgi:hypothetical protein